MSARRFGNEPFVLSGGHVEAELVLVAEQIERARDKHPIYDAVVKMRAAMIRACGTTPKTVRVSERMRRLMTLEQAQFDPYVDGTKYEGFAGMRLEVYPGESLSIVLL